MKIGLVIPNFDPALGGAEQWTWQFARWLTQAGQEVHVFATRFATCSAELPIVQHVVRAGQSRTGFAAAAEATLRREKLDVIHDMGAGWECDLFQPHGGSRQAAFQQNLKLCPAWLRPLKQHAARWLPRYRQFQALTNRQYARDGRLLLALSRMVARDFERHHHAPAEQIRIVYNGVDVERFSPQQPETRARIRAALGLRDEQTLLLIVAHNFALKGVPTAIRTVERLRRLGADVHLAIAGGKRVVHRREKPGRAIHLLGPVPDAAPYYAAADIYVQPTWYDPCSLVVLEALACGLPVITTRYNGTGELLTPGVEGFVMHDPGSATELADQIVPLLDSQARRQFSLAARKLALEHTLERNCQQIMAIYREIAARGQRQAA